MSEKRITITDIRSESLSFSNFDDLIDFIEKEVNFWSETRTDLGQIRGADFFNISNGISANINHYKDLKIKSSGYEEDPKMIAEFSRIENDILGWINRNWLYSATPFAVAVIEAYKKSPATGNAFKDCILQNRYAVNGNPPSMESFSGALLAYEFIYQDDTKITKRRNSEKKSFSLLRKRLESDAEGLSKDLEVIKKSYSEWDERVREDFDTWFESEKEKNKGFTDSIKKESRKSLDNYNAFFGEMCETSKSKISELESLYREKLRLEAPAEYWRKRAEKLSFQGGMWATFLGVFSVVVMVLTGSFFYTWLQKDPAQIGVPSLQGVGLFASTVAVAAYIIKTLSRLTFSSYHLQRDAEEREQLAYFYLSLIKEGAIDESSREIVLQSLFSRSESGLLGGDSGPLMPSPSEIIKTVKK